MSISRSAQRSLLAGETWAASRILSTSRIEQLISLCEIDTDDDTVCEDSRPPFSVFRLSSRDNSDEALLTDTDYSPQHETPDSVPSLSDRTASSEASTERQDQLVLACSHPRLSLLKTPRAENRLDLSDAYLFNCYISCVAPILIPVHTQQNPWLRYPAIALHQSFNQGRKHLLHAIMAIAAMHLEREGQKEMSVVGTKLYSIAMAELRSSIDDGSVDYLGLLTTVLTFLFIEVSARNRVRDSASNPN